MTGHHAVLVNNLTEAQDIIKIIGSDDKAIAYMGPKAVYRIIKLKNIRSFVANIIKQEMLAKGGEAAVNKQSLFAEGYTDVLLMGTLKQYRLLIKKLSLQPFNLKLLAEEIESILNNLEQDFYPILLAQGRSLEVGSRTLIMGILNVTPDSFSDGGDYYNPTVAINRARQMIEEGADIIDIGGASSRPNSNMVAEDIELSRVLPIVEALADEDIIISIDTFRGCVAKACLEKGAHIINDIGSLQLDTELLPLLVEKKAPVILMHNRMQLRTNEPYDDLISNIVEELYSSVDEAIKAGMDKKQIMLDPGIGFGKTVVENRIIIKRLWELKSLGYPIVLGASRKSFIGKTLNSEVDDRLEGSLAIASLGIMNGANIIRVHDVKESKKIAVMTDAVMRENG
ncbi:MAG: dihydropteroate synthase [Syntrophomonadaceae bacterium]|nr:dihydropteroate synthase [Syntrophomonadaceae bacterium]